MFRLSYRAGGGVGTVREMRLYPTWVGPRTPLRLMEDPFPRRHGRVQRLEIAIGLMSTNHPRKGGFRRTSADIYLAEDEGIRGLAF